MAGDRLPAQPEPLDKALPELDRWWLIYVSVVLSAAPGWFSEVSLFEGLVPVLVGGGSQIVHAVAKKARDPLAGVFEV